MIAINYKIEKEINDDSIEKKLRRMDFLLNESKMYATQGDFCSVSNSLRGAKKILDSIDPNHYCYNNAKLNYYIAHVQCNKRLE